MNPVRKKIRRYTIILFILSLLPYAMGVFGIYSSNKFSNIALSLSKAEKLKYLEMDQYKKMNITTVEKFDKFWMSNKIRLPKKTWIYFAITVILFVGLFLFQKWALFGIIIYSLYNIGSSALWFSPDVGASTATLAGKVAQIATYLIIVVYYARKNVRQVFIEKS
jgi:hypothetical protein